jgi:hypothetical protein
MQQPQTKKFSHQIFLDEMFLEIKIEVLYGRITQAMNEA